MRRSLLTTITLVAAVTTVLFASPPAAAAPQQADFTVAEVPSVELRFGGYLIATELVLNLCINPSIDVLICADFGPITSASAGTTVWADETSSDLPLWFGETRDVEAVAAYLTNGRPDWIVQAFLVGLGGGGVGGEEDAFFGDQAGPSGVDLFGYTVNRIGFRVDAVSFETPGSDPNGDGFWTDVSLRGTYVFQGTINADGCKNGGWQILRGPNGLAFNNQGDCTSFAMTGM